MTLAKIRKAIKSFRYPGAVTSLPLVQCCAPLAEPSLTDREAKELETVFKALADRHRVKILNRLIGAGGAAVCVCDFEELLDLKQLLDAGIVEREKRGSYAYFSLAPGALEQVSGLLRYSVAVPAAA